MPLPDQKSLKTQIIMLFRKNDVLEASTIRLILEQRGDAYSVQAIYKELRHLSHEGIIKKIGKVYSINATWALQLQVFAQKIVQKCLQSDASIPLLKEGEHAQWKFHNLNDLNDFWAHMALHLRNITQDPIIYAWNPHLWFWLTMPEKEERFYKSLSLTGGKFHVIAGNLPLNLLFRKIYARNKNTIYKFDSNAFPGKMGTYYNVIGDYVITVKLSRKTFANIDTLFSTTDSNKTTNSEQLNRLLLREQECVIRLDHHHQKAKKLRKIFENYFD